MDVGALSEIVSRILPMPISSSAPGSFNAETNPRTAFRSRPIAVQPAEDKMGESSHGITSHGLWLSSSACRPAYRLDEPIRPEPELGKERPRGGLMLFMQRRRCIDA